MRATPRTDKAGELPAGRHSVRRRLLIGVVMLSIAVLIVLGLHAVDNRTSDEDLRFVRRFVPGIEPLPEDRTFADEMALIMAVQHAVLARAPGDDGIPFDRPREPKDLYQAGSGLCYDRSRTIEKALRYARLRTRHVAFFAIGQDGSALRALLTSSVPSHAVTEVRTRRGWLVVDSNDPWVSIDAEGKPRSMRDIRSAAEGQSRIHWQRPPPADIYNEPLVFVYGLYSRHGRFYPPFGPIPDIHYGELLGNLLPAGPSDARQPR